MLKVTKFGGSSVSNAEQFKKVKSIIDSDNSRKIVVVSAAGKRDSKDHKLTDLLYLCHAHLTYGVPCDDIFETITERFVEIRDSLGLAYKVEDDLAILKKSLTKDMSVDELVSRGEFFTSRLMAEYLGFYFLDAKDCIYMGFDGQFDMEKTTQAISKALKEHDKLVIPGFYGSIPSGKVKVMSRGGSDISGALAAAAVKADVYENWTDVSGILMADPKIVKNPASISQITYSELKELAFLGASVLHEDSIQPVKDAKIPLNIRNTNNPANPGTMIVDYIEKDNSKEERFITGIAGRKNFSIITVRKRNIRTNEKLGQGLDVLDHYGIMAEHITLGLDSFAIVVSQENVGDKLYNIISDLEKALDTNNIQVQEGIALVAAVGRKMTFRPGISGKIFMALGKKGVNIRTIAQGADELSIVIGVDNSQFDETVRVLYEGFAG